MGFRSRREGGGRDDEGGWGEVVRSREEMTEVFSGDGRGRLSELRREKDDQLLKENEEAGGGKRDEKGGVELTFLSFSQRSEHFCQRERLLSLM